MMNSHECSHDTYAADGEHTPCCDPHQVLLHSMQTPGTFQLQENHQLVSIILFLVKDMIADKRENQYIKERV